MAKILVIDDDETLHIICRTYLTKAGHTVETAFDGIEGLEKAAAFHPDIILLDINMPKLSGFDAAKRLKENPETKGAAIFMMSSLKQEANIQKGYGLGIDEYITKPANMEHLKLRIEKYTSKK